MSKPNWFYHPIASSEEIKSLMSELKVDYPIACLLTQRGINTFKKAKDFFRPHLSHLHSPFLMKDMKKAIVRILEAIEKKQTICVYGDYDVDGTSAVAIMVDFLKGLSNRVIYYVPDREEEGYGISFKGIDHSLREETSLMIALDCGIKEIEKVSYAKGKGMDMILCDHHLPGENIPQALAILNPKQKDCSYPFKELSGCAIGFKLIEGMVEYLKLPKKRAYKYLDLVALSTVADIMPIVEENRILVFYGLMKLNKAPSIGLVPFIKEAKKEITTSEILFYIAPRINAAGRIKHAQYALDLLLSQTTHQADEAFNKILDLNSFRKELDKRSTQEALEIIKLNKQEENYANIIYDPSWHKGILGIIASRVMETYYKPTLIFTQDKKSGKLAGSARSIEGFNIYEALEKCALYIEEFGGHKYAAGLSIKEENFQPFKRQFEKIAKQSLSHHKLVAPIKIDYQLNFNEITARFLRILKQFEPFGPGNPKPLFHSNNLLTHSSLYRTISNPSHLKVDIYQKEHIQIRFSSIGFNMGAFKEKLKEGPFEMIYSIEENLWMGRSCFELYIKDIFLPTPLIR